MTCATTRESPRPCCRPSPAVFRASDSVGTPPDGALAGRENRARQPAPRPRPARGRPATTPAVRAGGRSRFRRLLPGQVGAGRKTSSLPWTRRLLTPSVSAASPISSAEARSVAKRSTVAAARCSASSGEAARTPMLARISTSAAGRAEPTAAAESHPQGPTASPRAAPRARLLVPDFSCSEAHGHFPLSPARVGPAVSEAAWEPWLRMAAWRESALTAEPALS